MQKSKVFSVFLLIGCVLIVTYRRRRNSFVVKTKAGQSVRIRTGVPLSPSDRREDYAIQCAVSKQTREQLQKGVPVARYDVKKKAVYVEYPDGRIQYQTET